MVTNRYQATITMDEEMRDDIDGHRHPATSRSEWVREAIKARLEAENRNEWDDFAPTGSKRESENSAEDGTRADV
ncbi:ribbon-helix-helix domain-containing protein [Haloferax sp. ATB1]|uniref:ribbon-helix-helix domain-containing protein n=1 Tax=Haloferax sp. ATB1 TaxID=1508454 RepID=UPI0005B1F031|nr:ribbon-helix-helix domain-containing protein [Haloferax sp. ATB1]